MFPYRPRNKLGWFYLLGTFRMSCPTRVSPLSVFVSMVSTRLMKYLPILILTLSFVSSPILCAEEERNADEIRYFLTSQEKLYEGIPEDRGDSWLIKLPGQTGGLLVSKLDIIFIGDSRDDVFDFQKEKLPPGNFGAAAKLAEWGTRNQLSDRALDLLKEMIAEADPETRVVLQRQIDRIEYVENLKKNAQDRLSVPSFSHPAPKTKTPEMKRLEEFSRHVPISVQDSYARKIQPLLLNRCALSDCHQAGTPDRNLLFVKPEKRTVRQGNLLNLEQILRRVDLAEPAKSPILNHPEITDQYGQQVYPFGNDANTLKDFKLFTEWIASLEKKVKPFPHDFEFDRPVLPRNLPELHQTPTTFSSVYAPRPIDLTDSSDEDDVPSPSGYQIIAPSSSASIISNLDEMKFRDEFDPEPFNRKYHPDIDPKGKDSDESN